MQFRGGAPSAGLFQARRCGQRRSRRRPSIPGQLPGPARDVRTTKLRRDSARNMPSTGPGAATETAQTTHPQPRGWRSSTRAIASRLGTGGRRHGLETASPESVGRRALQRPAGASPRGLLWEGSGRQAPPTDAQVGPGGGRPGRRARPRKEMSGSGSLSPDRGRRRDPARLWTPVDTRREANLSCGVARRSSTWPRCRRGSRLPAERSMRPCPTGDSMPRPCRAVASGTGQHFPRPETHP